MKKVPTKEITLDGGAIVTIPVQFEYAKCKGCSANDLIWATTKNGKSMPIRWDEIKGAWISHFTDCPKSNNFRKGTI
jgi:hypothetical protein